MLMKIADWIVEILGIVENPDRSNRVQEGANHDEPAATEEEMKEC